MKHSIRKALLPRGILPAGRPSLSAAAQPFLRLPAIIGDHMGPSGKKPPSGCTGWPIPNATLTVTFVGAKP